MKKFVSFVCCLLLAFAGLASRVFADFPHHAEIIYLTLKSNPNLRLATPTLCLHGEYWEDGHKSVGCGDCGNKGKWMVYLIDSVAHKYILQNCVSVNPVFTGQFWNNTPVLDESLTYHTVSCWTQNCGDNQSWIFEPADSSLRYFRLRNLASGRYLTMKSGSKECYTTVRADRGAEYDGQIWEKHESK